MKKVNRKSLPPDRSFQNLTTQINQNIIKNKGLVGDQEDQVELLFSLERKFQYYVNKYVKAKDVYSKFIKFITDKNQEGNILKARPYFREKAGVFSKHIAPALKNNDIEELMKYQINYQFISFMVDQWKGPFPEKPQRYYNDYLEARRILIENNLPLVINRAKLFFRKTPRSHLDLLDLIDICTMGLINGIDKYVGKYTKVWRSVCIGRIVGNLIEEYSKTFIRLYPADKKILYRANSIKFRQQIENIDELTAAVNKSFEEDKANGKKVPTLPISEDHIRTLMGGMNSISSESKMEDGQDNDICIYDYTASDTNLEEEVSHKNAINAVKKASSDLELVEKKVIRLKGVNV